LATALHTIVDINDRGIESSHGESEMKKSVIFILLGCFLAQTAGATARDVGTSLDLEKLAVGTALYSSLRGLALVTLTDPDSREIVLAECDAKSPIQGQAPTVNDLSNCRSITRNWVEASEGSVASFNNHFMNSIAEILQEKERQSRTGYALLNVSVTLVADAVLGAVAYTLWVSPNAKLAPQRTMRVMGVAGAGALALSAIMGYAIYKDLSRPLPNVEAKVAKNLRKLVLPEGAKPAPGTGLSQKELEELSWVYDLIKEAMIRAARKTNEA
jgi:hypothetical protein